MTSDINSLTDSFTCLFPWLIDSDRYQTWYIHPCMLVIRVWDSEICTHATYYWSSRLLVTGVLLILRKRLKLHLFRLVKQRTTPSKLLPK